MTRPAASASLTVKTKLLMLVLSSLIGSAILGIAGTWAVSRVANLVSDIYNKQLTTIVSVSDANVRLVNYQNTLYNIAVESDPAARSALVTRLDAAEKSLLALIDTYKQAELTFNERAAIEEFEATWFPYKATVKEVLEASERDVAIDLMTLVAKPTYDTAAEKLERIVEVNRAAAKDSFDASEKLAAQIRLGQILVAAFIAVVGLLLGKRMATDLKNINDNLELIVETRTAALREKTNDINAMMQNLPEGVMTIVGTGVIHPEYSHYLETIFGTTDIAGKPALEFLLSDSNVGSDARAAAKAAIGACLGEDRMNFDFNAHVLVTEFRKQLPNGDTKWLNLVWSPICDAGDQVEKLMVCVRDVTALRELEAEAGAQKRELEMIGQILVVNQEKFHEFVDSSRKFVSENEALLQSAQNTHPELVSQLFRNMHTIKGNARTYGLLHLTNIVHEAEQAYDQLRKNPALGLEKQTLLDNLQLVMQRIEEYASLNEVKLGRKGPGRRGSTEKYVMVRREQIEEMLADLAACAAPENAPALRSAAGKRLEMGLRLIGTEPVQTVLAGVFDSLPSLARELGKEAPQLQVDDNGIYLRNQVTDLLRNVFMHLYRNAIDHGIETTTERRAAGKPEAGCIRLAVGVEGEQLRMQLSDDGRGLALAYIKRRAREGGLIGADVALSDEEAAQLIFAPGFSTASAVTEVSGRGVGMDAVRDFITREGGSIALRFTDTAEGADFRRFETLIVLPGKFAVASH